MTVLHKILDSSFFFFLIYQNYLLYFVAGSLFNLQFTSLIAILSLVRKIPCGNFVKPDKPKTTIKQARLLFRVVPTLTCTDSKYRHNWTVLRHLSPLFYFIIVTPSYLHRFLIPDTVWGVFFLLICHGLHHSYNAIAAYEASRVSWYTSNLRHSIM